MNRKNLPNNKKNTHKIKKKFFFILIIIGGTIVIILLIAAILFAKKFNQKKDNQLIDRKETNLEINSPKKKLLFFPGEQNNCPFIDEQELDAQLSKFNKKENQKEWIKKKLAELRQKVPQDYIIKLWKKGYHHWDIEQLWDWGVREEEIPDLNSPKRVGVINELFVIFDFDKIIDEKKEDKKDIYIGGTKNLVVIGRKVSSGGQIYIDKAFFNAPMTQDEKQSGHYVKRVVNFALQQENVNPGQYDIFVLSAAGRENFGQESKIGFGRSGGKSAGSALYLALLSALYQKPLSGQVAATGALSLSTKRKKWGKVNGREFQIVPGDNLPIGGLKHKVLACAEKGINFLVLSKYQTSPNLLSEWQREGKWRGCWDGENNKLYTKGKWRKPAEDYSKVVPSETRKKMTVHWTENIYGLRELVLGGKLT